LLEKKKKRDQRRADIDFFRIMEQNLINSLRRGEKIPCVSPDRYNKEGPPCEPTTSPPQTHNIGINQLQHLQQNKNNIGNDKAGMNNATVASQSIGSGTTVTSAKVSRVRTISGMDQHILAQLGSTSHPVTATTGANPVLSSTNGGGILASNSKPSPNTSARSGGNINNNSTVRVPSNQHQHDVNYGVASSTTTGAGLPLIEGRPPLAQRRSSTASTSSAVPSTANSSQQQSTTIAPPQSSSSSLTFVDDPMDSLELSPDAEDFGGKTIDMELRGVDLLLDDGSIEDDSGEHVGTAKAPENRQPDNNSSTNGTANPIKSPTANSTNHVRRHTGNTMHFDTTMDNPNIDATMQCVCGVYRAHIVQTSELQQSMPPNQQQQNYNPAIDVFRDDYEQYCLSIAKGGSTPFNRTNPPLVPSLVEIKAFYNEFYQRSQMEHDTIIMSLIYVERLMKDTNGALTPNTYNWRSVLFSCMILASKVWDDLSMWNIDFSNVSVAASSSSNLLSAFSLQRINQLELAVLTNLSFRTAIPASEYAKYYFLIRTMLMRSGILKGNISDNNNNNYVGGIYRTKQQEAEAANRLENRSSLYQANLSCLSSSTQISTQQQQHPDGSSSSRVGSTGTHRAAARSIDWSYFMSRGGSNSNNNNTEDKKMEDTTPVAAEATTARIDTVPFSDMAHTNDLINDITTSTSTLIGPVLHDTVCLKQIVSSG
jgi:Cyclin, N-terminal domain